MRYVRRWPKAPVDEPGLNGPCHDIPAIGGVNLIGSEGASSAASELDPERLLFEGTKPGHGGVLACLAMALDGFGRHGLQRGRGGGREIGEG